VFLTLTAEDLKEIGLDKFGPRRKITNAIASWHKENNMPANNIGNNDASLATQLESLQQDLKEKTWQLSQVESNEVLIKSPVVSVK